MERKTVLIVEDEKSIVDILRFNLQKEGYRTLEAYDGAAGLKLALEENPDLILLDLMLPAMNGFEVCKTIRDKGYSTPVLIITAREAEKDKILGLDLGADDYITKPFSIRELMARVNVIVNRHRVQPGAKREQIEVGALRIDVSGRNVYVDGEKTELTAKEYDLLVYLVKNRGMVLTREQILNAVWGYEYRGADRTVDWQIKLLRNKLGSCRSYLATIRGVGYKFEAEA